MRIYKKYPCPCCGTADMLYKKAMYEICHTCGWEDDWQGREEPDVVGINNVSMNEARRIIANGGKFKDRFPIESAPYYDIDDDKEIG